MDRDEKVEAIGELISYFQVNAKLFLSAVFSIPRNTTGSYSADIPQGCIRTKVRMANHSGGNSCESASYFVEFFTRTKVFHRSYSEDALLLLVQNAGEYYFKNMRFRFNSPDTDEIQFLHVLVNKRGQARLLRGTESAEIEKQHGDNLSARQKNYLIPAGIPVPFLIYLGVMSDSGKVLAAKQGKFRQINRFLECLDDVLADTLQRRTESDAKNAPFRVIDFGCGNSYLTFAIHYYLTKIRKVEASILGIDQNSDIIANCNKLAETLACSGLSFRNDSVENFSVANSDVPDVLISLHACNTATDYALAYGIQHGVATILSVPCCQHELNSQLVKNKKNDSAKFAKDDPFSLFTAHGLLKERFSALATDAIRVRLLEDAGYAVHVMEFVETEATAKNVLIRAVRKTSGNIRTIDLLKAEQNHRKDPLSDILGVTLTLEKLQTDYSLGSK